MKLQEITTNDAMRATVNRGLMISWINADLIERAGCDVRRSVILYDADGLFMHACDAGLSGSAFTDRLDGMKEQLLAAGVRFYSIGVK
jgi:hypothetical protein